MWIKLAFVGVALMAMAWSFFPPSESPLLPKMPAPPLPYYADRKRVPPPPPPPPPTWEEFVAAAPVSTLPRALVAVRDLLRRGSLSANRPSGAVAPVSPASQAGPGGPEPRSTLLIAQTATTLTIDRAMLKGVERWTFPLDGCATTNVVRPGFK